MTEKRNILRDLFSKKMLIVLMLGFSSGLPLLLTGGTLKTWLARDQVDITTIGYFSWVGMAYLFKFVWSPLLDHYTLFKMGRRRSWMIVTQILLMISIYYIGTLSPKESLSAMAAVAILIALFSATQDIAIDAYRRELLSNEELGLGSSMNTYGYRIAMLISGGAGIGLVGSEVWPITWGQLYFLMAGCMAVGIITTLLAPEPKVDGPQPKSLLESIINPFAEFLKRPGAWYILSFVFLFKLGDAVSGSLLNPFYVEMGFSNADIGLIAKTFGFFSSLAGLFLGGLLIYYFGIYKSLWTFGILQGLSTAAFGLLTFTGAQNWALASVVIFEDVSSGMGSAAFVSLLGSLSNKKYTATQYALLSSLAGFGRNFVSGFGGGMVKDLGWAPFFYVCALAAIPGLFMLLGMKKYQTE